MNVNKRNMSNCKTIENITTTLRDRGLIDDKFNIIGNTVNVFPYIDKLNEHARNKYGVIEDLVFTKPIPSRLGASATVKIRFNHEVGKYIDEYKKNNPDKQYQKPRDFQSVNNVNENNTYEELQAPITDNFLDLVKYKKAQLEQVNKNIAYLSTRLNKKNIELRKEKYKEQKKLENQITELTDPANTIEFMYNAIFTQLEDIRNSIKNETLDLDTIDSELKFLEEFITGKGKEENDFSIFNVLRDDYKRELKTDSEGKEYSYDRGFKSMELLLKNTKKDLEKYKEDFINKVLTGDVLEPILRHLNSREITTDKGKVEKNKDYYKSRELLKKGEDYVITEEDLKETSRDIGKFSKYMLGIDDSVVGGGLVLAQNIMKQQYTTTQNYYKNYVANISEKLSTLEKEVGDTSFLYKKDEEDNKTLFLTSLFSNKWNKYKKDLTKNFGKFYFENNWKLKKSQYQKISRSLKNNSNVINPAKLMYFKSKMENNPNYDTRYSKYFTYSDNEMIAYEKELKDLLGPMYDIHIQQLEEIVDNLDNHITETEISGSYVEQNIYKKNFWEYTKNLESFGGGILDKIHLGFTTKGQEMLFQDFKSLVIIPKNTILGKNTEYYDENFKRDMQDPKKFALWKEFKKMSEFISETYSESIVQSEELMLPFVVESFKSSVANIKNIESLKNKGEEKLSSFQQIFAKDTKKDTKDESFIRSNYSNEATNRIKSRATLYQAQGMTRDAAYKKAEVEVLSNLKEDTLIRDIIAVGNLAAQHVARQTSLPVAKALEKHMAMKSTMSARTYAKYKGWYRQNILNTSIEVTETNSLANRDIGKFKILSLEEKRLKREFKKLKELNKLGSVDKVIIKKRIKDKSFDFGYELDLDGSLIYTVNGIQSSFDKYQEEYNRYIDAEIENLGVNLNLMGLINGKMKISTIASLGLNPISGMFNRTEGIHTNSLLDSTGEYWTPGNDIKSKKALQFTNANHYAGKYNRFLPQETNDFNRQFKKLLEHFSSIQDKRNELERADDVVNMSFSIKTFDFGKMLMAWSQERPEFKNQGQVILNMLQDLVIEKDGEVIQFFDGYNFNGLIENSDGSISLHPDFQSEFESLSSDKMLKEYSTIATILNRVHGNYDSNDTLLYKGTLEGRLAGQFKGWLGAHIMQRYTETQHEGQLNIDLATGKLRQDGRHIKFLKNHPWLAGFNMIASMGNTWGGTALMGASALTIGGAATGGLLMLPGIALWVKANMGNKNSLNIEIKDTMNLAIYLREILLNSLNYVPKTLLSKDLLKLAESKSDKLKNRGFNDLSQDDIRNLQTMAQELAIQLSMISFKIMLYTIFASLLDSDDEDKESTLNVTHNFLQNQLSRSANSIGSWSSMPLVGPFIDNSKISLIREIEKAYNLLSSDKAGAGDYLAFGLKSFIGTPTHIVKYMDKGLLPWQDEKNYDVNSLNRNFKWVHDNFYLDDEARAKKKYEKIREEKKEEFRTIILDEFQNKDEVEVVLKGLMQETIGNKDKNISYEETLEILENEEVLNTRETRDFISNKLSEQGMPNEEIQEKMTNIYSKINR